MKLTFLKYRLPFSSAFITSKTTFKYREGFIIKYSGDGFSGYGEAAPLPGFSVESLGDVRQQITHRKNEFEAAFADKNPAGSLKKLYDKAQIPASLQFGLDSLAYQLKAFRSGSSLQNFLFDDSPQEIPVNAVVSLHSDNFLTETRQFVSEGFQTIKSKMGLHFEREFERLQQIRAQFPNLAIRLDANQAWQVDEAISHFKKMQHLDIEYCEEPLRMASIENFQKLAAKTSIRLALDESLIHHPNPQSLLPFTSVLIIKPMVIGSFSKTFVTKRLAGTHDNKVVLTTSLESGVGRMTTAILASGLGSKNMAQGLNTGHFLAQDVFSDESYIADGMYRPGGNQNFNIQSKFLRTLGG